jgi:transglutaminase-like putative cysteine protease
MNRRTFLRGAASLPVAAGASRVAGFVTPALAQQKEFTPRPGTWRTFEITTRVEILEASGVSRAWLPIPSVRSDYQKPQGDQWSGNAKVMKAVSDGGSGATMLYAEFAPGESAPVVELTSRFQAQDRALDWSKKVAVDEDPAILKNSLKSTDLIPTDGIVRETALELTRGKASDVEKVRAIYDRILASCYRDPKVRGCGVGDIRAMLETKNFGGKCGDINGLFVGLSRAAGVPARDLYGIRVAPSAFGYKSLGAGSANISKAQHCRAEVFLTGYGWVPVDPADVRKVVLEEPPGQLSLSDPKVVAARKTLFGAWEMNWLAYNVAHDLALPGSSGPKVGFLMYPQAEVGGERLDALEPDAFKYVITAKEITA